MNLEVVIKDGAKADITAGYRHYHAISSNLADDFLDRVGRGLERIQSGPKSYARVFDEIRQAKIRRFPYVISYLFENNRIIVLAVLHGPSSLLKSVSISESRKAPNL